MNRALAPIAAALALLALAAAPTATGGRQSPGAFVAQVFQWAFNGQGDRLYNSLVPQQRRLISRSVYDGCIERGAATLTSATTVTSWKTIDQLPVTITIPGTRTRVKALAVTVRLTASDGSSTVQTAHLVATNTGWAWMLDATKVAKYHARRC